MIRRNSPIRISDFQNVIFALAIILSVIAAVLWGFTYVSFPHDEVSEKIAKAKKESDKRALKECPVIVTIVQPANGQHVSGDFSLCGRCTVHDRCKHLYVVIESEQGEAYVKKYKRLEMDGRFNLKLKVDELGAAEEAKIQVLVCSKPDTYAIGKPLPYSNKSVGTESNTIRVVRRMENEKPHIRPSGTADHVPRSDGVSRGNR